MIFLVFFSLAAAAINISPVIAAENSTISKEPRINPISGDQTRLNGPGKEIQFQQVCTDDVYEFDNSYLQAKTITTDGIPQSHNNHPATEEDWVTFHAIARDQYEIGTRLTNDINQSDSGANDTLLYLYAPDGVTQLAFNDDVGDFNWYMGSYHYRESLITWTAPSTGDYYVRELQWGPTVGYDVRDCHTYNMWVIDITTTPILALSKTSTTGSVTFAGQVIPYTYQLTNNTNATLTGIVLNDNKTVPSCPQTTLAVGVSMACTASYTVTQADVNAGGFLTNSVNARYDPDIVITNHLDIPIIQNRSLTMVKGITNGDSYSVVSGIIDYSYDVTNSGNVSLAGPVTVTDDQAAAVSCPNVNTIGNLNANLDPGEMLTCTASHTVTQGDLDAGSVTNHATAHAAGINSNQASKTATATQSPALGIEKSVTETGYSTVGTVLHYSYKVTNSGNVTLSGPFTVTDDKATDEACPVTPTLAPGSFITCTASYTITQGDLDSGSVTNIASAHGSFGGSPVDSTTDTKTIIATQSPALGVEKIVTETDYSTVGTALHYSYKVTNSGNVTLSGPFTVTDDKATDEACPVTPTLAPGSFITCTASYTITQGDLDSGSVTNIASAHGSFGGSPVGSATDSKTIYATQSPLMTVKKSSLTSSVSITGTVDYSYLVTNTGNVTLTGISLSDNNDNDDMSCPSMSLAPGANMTCTATHTVTQIEIDAGGNLSNKVTASSNEAVDATDTLDIPITQTPLIHVLKSSLTPSVDHAGQVVPYTFLVTNTGNVTLTGISVSDPNCAAAPAYQSGDANTDDRLDLVESWTYTCSHTVTRDEMDAGGKLANTVTVGSDQSGNATGYLDIPITLSPGLSIQKNGSLDMTVVAPDDVANVGDVITYTFTLQNTGNVTLTDISVSDPRLPALGCSIASLAPGTSAGCASINNEYNLTQTDIDNGSVSNTAVAKGKDPQDGDIYGSDSATVTIPQSPVIGLAKRMVGNPVEVSPGTWDVTFEFLLENYGNVALGTQQVADDLTLSFPAPTTFAVRSVTSPSFTVNWNSPSAPTDFNGAGNNNLLTGVDTLAIGGQGTITMVIRVVPASAGPFENSATASGSPPIGSRVSDVSSDGTDPDHTINCSVEDSCINDDGNPNNNTKSTPVIFAENLFDPPFGIKSVDSSGLPELTWTLVWINGSNIVAQGAAVSDPIPVGTTYVDGSLSCTGASILTTTAACAYEIPSVPYPLGRVVWTGTIGPDFGATDAASANNELTILYKVRINSGVNSVRNTAALDADLNGDGDMTDPGEPQVASASSSWRKPPNPPDSTPTPNPPVYGFIIPVTGFAPNRETFLPSQTISYAELGDLWLEIPRLGVQMPIVGIPQANGTWDVSWLGSDAGWLNGSAYPTWHGNSVITGHVTDASGNPGPFARLNTLWWGDKVIVHISGAQYIYEVRSIQQSSPANSAAMMKHEELPWVTLVTCRGYDVTSNSYLYRVLVRAVLVEVR